MTIIVNENDECIGKVLQIRKNLSRVECAWLAGLIEGEGSFSIHWRISTAGINYPFFSMKVGMTDFDIIEKIYKMTGTGTVIVRPPFDNKRKPVKVWSLFKRAEIKYICESILPFMGKRRTKRIEEVLQCMEDYPHKNIY